MIVTTTNRSDVRMFIAMTSYCTMLLGRNDFQFSRDIYYISFHMQSAKVKEAEAR
jgi:hypothetical protein